MKPLGEHILYYNTDSIIFSAKEGEYIPPLGPYLGQFTNELECAEVGCSGCETGHWIDEFVSCGPKNYTFHLNTGQVMCKVHGFSFNYENSQILNFELMKHALFSWKANEPEEFVTVSTVITQDKFNPQIYNQRVSKQYGVVYDKHQVLDNLTT